MASRMARVFALIGASVCAGLLLAGPAHGARPTKVGPLPNAELTPGAIHARVTQENVRRTICVSGYTKAIRKVSTKTKS
jgi:hypothetical protein